jgi:hypothetical protein
MFKSVEEVKFDNGDEVTVRLSEYHSEPCGRHWVELHIWDDYEGRGGSAALYDLESLDKVIAMLQNARKEMV